MLFSGGHFLNSITNGTSHLNTDLTAFIGRMVSVVIDKIADKDFSLENNS